MADTGPTKEEVRRDALARRDRLTAAERTQLGIAARRRLLRLATMRRARALFCFVSFRTEIDTLPILRWALRRGLVTAVPQVLGPRRMAAVRITDLSDLAIRTRPGWIIFAA